MALNTMKEFRGAKVGWKATALSSGALRADIYMNQLVQALHHYNPM
jgi:hypothetical protein